MKHLYFCRHGECTFNAEQRWAGSSETPLTPKGVSQARDAGVEAQKLGIDYIISSPLSRAYDTAKIIAEAIGYPVDKIDTHNILVERHFGVLEAQPWEPDTDMDTIADAETSEGMWQRVQLSLKHLENLPAEKILVVGHGHYGRVLRHMLHPEIPLKGSQRFENAKLVKLL